MPAKKKIIKKALKTAKKKAPTAVPSFTSVMSGLRDGSQPVGAKRTPHVYQGTIKLVADRKLSRDETALLESAVWAQLAEPTGIEGEKRAGFSTSDVRITLKRVHVVTKRRLGK